MTDIAADTSDKLLGSGGSKRARCSCRHRSGKGCPVNCLIKPQEVNQVVCVCNDRCRSLWASNGKVAFCGVPTILRQQVELQMAILPCTQFKIHRQRFCVSLEVDTVCT